jgi:Rrf2 family protein
MKVSRTIAYAIDATVRIAREDAKHPIPCSHLARVGQLPERFLLQVLRCLVNNGVLRSSRGVDGGYALARRPEDITILQIVKAFDNPLESSIPPTNGVQYDARTKILAALRLASSAAAEQLQRLTIADLMDSERPQFDLIDDGQ